MALFLAICAFLFGLAVAFAGLCLWLRGLDDPQDSDAAFRVRCAGAVVLIIGLAVMWHAGAAIVEMGNA